MGTLKNLEMENITAIKKEYEERFTMGSYEKYIWEFVEEKLKRLLTEKEGKLNGQE